VSWPKEFTRSLPTTETGETGFIRLSVDKMAEDGGRKQAFFRGPPTPAVNGPGRQCLACAAFPLQENHCLTVGRLARQGKRSLRRRAPAHKTGFRAFGNRPVL